MGLTNMTMLSHSRDKKWSQWKTTGENTLCHTSMKKPEKSPSNTEVLLMEHWTKKNAHQYHQLLEFTKLDHLLTCIISLTDKFNNYQLLQFHLRSVLSIDSVV